MDKKTLKNNLSIVQSRISEAAIKDDITLVAVSKYSPYEDIKSLYELGHRDFGENRIKDLVPKALSAREDGLSDIRWHFIGNIQSKDIKKISNVPNLFSVHSLDNISHLEKFSKLLNHPVNFFLQFNTSGESEKSGLINGEDISGYIDLFNSHNNLIFFGLMTMGKLRGDDLRKDALVCFKSLVEIRDCIDSKLLLSMGMSSDYDIALECGSDVIRVGSAIFK